MARISRQLVREVERREVRHFISEQRPRQHRTVHCLEDAVAMDLEIRAVRPIVLRTEGDQTIEVVRPAQSVRVEGLEVPALVGSQLKVNLECTGECSMREDVHAYQRGAA